MLKNITLSAEEILIKKAREKARKKNTTLNNAFREWLKEHMNGRTVIQDYRQFMKSVKYVKPGKKFTREEMNER